MRVLGGSDTSRAKALRYGYGLAIALLLLAAACGGSGSGNSTTPPPGTGGGGTTPPANPCTAALASDEGTPQIVGMVASGQSAPTVSDKTKPVVDSGDPRSRALAALFLHDQAKRHPQNFRLKPEATGAEGTGAVAADVGDIAVLQDSGDLILPKNLIDIKSSGLRFTPSGGGYAVSKIDGNFRQALGTRLTLGDDDSAEVDVPFAFNFYGANQQAAFVNSDGNVTFGEEDKASTDRDITRLISGPPRVSPFLSDLDPTSGGRIYVNAASDQYTVTWCSVRGFDSILSVTAQATLLPDGSVEYKYADFNLGDAIIGLSPGHTGTFTAMDLSQLNPPSGTGAIGERFASHIDIDTVAVAKKFYASHPDNYDQVLLWTDQQVVTGGTFSYELTVANDVKGIGEDIYDLSHDFGSAGRLHSLVVMDAVTKFPNDPTQKFLGENNTLSVIGQEVGHRWLAYLQFRDHTGAVSDALLGRDQAHWSFFFNSDASVMEGNQIQDQGGGKFLTTDAVKRFSRLDQYAMGLILASQVPAMFYVEAPTGGHQAADAPQIGVSFTGTRRDFLIDDVIAVNQPNPSNIAKIDNIRQQWAAFFLQATDNRMTAVTTLK
jgi:hypothetical protein